MMRMLAGCDVHVVHRCEWVIPTVIGVPVVCETISPAVERWLLTSCNSAL
jgi:hypothetical protein